MAISEKHLNGTTGTTASVEIDPEVSVKPTKKRYPPEFKVQTLQDLDQMRRSLSGDYLRQENLYSSLVSQWRQERDEIYLAHLKTRKRGRKSSSEKSASVEKLKRKNAQLKDELTRSKLVLDVQKKILSMSELLTSMED
jgi:transposase-like protein